jgi:hypothetical protein
MKRVAEHSLTPEVAYCKQTKRGDELRKHFHSLWPYEQRRLLYSYIGLIPFLVCDVICLVINDLMRFHCAPTVCGVLCGQTRCYLREDGPALYDALREEERLYFKSQVQRGRQLLLAQGIPESSHCIINANTCGDGRGVIMYYHEDFMAHHLYASRLFVPPTTYYACVDMERTDVIRTMLSRQCLSDVLLQQFRLIQLRRASNWQCVLFSKSGLLLNSLPLHED